MGKIAADDFLDALGLSNADFAEAVEAAFDSEIPVHDIVGLMESLDKIDAALFPPAVRARAMRVLRALDHEFPHSFGENKPSLFEDAVAAARESEFTPSLGRDHC